MEIVKFSKTTYLISLPLRLFAAAAKNSARLTNLVLHWINIFSGKRWIKILEIFATNPDVTQNKFGIEAVNSRFSKLITQKSEEAVCFPGILHCFSFSFYTNNRIKVKTKSKEKQSKLITEKILISIILNECQIKSN